MPTTFITKSDVNFSHENIDETKVKKATEEFVNKTNITPKAVFSKKDLKALNDKKNGFLLENIIPTNNTSGTVRCDHAFYDLMKKRNENSFSQRVKDSGKWEKGNWLFLVIAAILVFVAFFFFKPHVNEYNAQDTQFETAKKLIDNGLKNSEAQVPGPLNININEFTKSYKVQQTIDSLTKVKDSLQNELNKNSNKLRDEASAEKNVLEEKKKTVADSINNILLKQANQIMENAQYSFKNNEIDEAQNQAEQLRAKKLKASNDSLIRIANEATQKRIDQLVSITDQPIIVADSTISAKIQYINTIMPKAIPYKYDLLNGSPEVSWWWNVAFWVSAIIGFILIILFGWCVISLFKELSPPYKESIQYFADTLRAMAFPGKQNRTGNDYTCEVSFSTLSLESQRLLQSVLIRYPWNTLTGDTGFEFIGKLKSTEVILNETKMCAPEPLLFVYEGDMVIVYAGLGEDIVKEEKKNLLVNVVEAKSTESKKSL